MNFDDVDLDQLIEAFPFDDVYEEGMENKELIKRVLTHVLDGRSIRFGTGKKKQKEISFVILGILKVYGLMGLFEEWKAIKIKWEMDSGVLYMKIGQTLEYWTSPYVGPHMFMAIFILDGMAFDSNGLSLHEDDSNLDQLEYVLCGIE